MTSPEATPQQGSTRSPGSPDPTSPRPTSPGPTSGNSSARTCRPEIHQSPAPGGLELLCEAACSPGVAVRWIQAPGGLEAYDRREAGAQAWLSMPWAECTPEGWFQCRLDPGGQMASLYLVPQICKFWDWGGPRGATGGGGTPCITPDQEVPHPASVARRPPRHRAITVAWHGDGCKFQGREILHLFVN